MHQDKWNEQARDRRATVLVVDDEVPIGRVIRRVLDGHDVTVVTSAKEALELVASGKRFDVILSDLMMPDMTGMSLYDQLSNELPAVAERMVFMTGTSLVPAVHEFLERVPNERLDKPFAIGAMRAVVQKVAARSTARNSCRSGAISRDDATDVE